VLTLLGWVAYHGAVFLGAELAQYSAWLLIPALSVGVVFRLATVVIALRSVATELGAPALLAQVAPAETVDDDRDRSLSRLLGVTLLPFLAVYAAFGYVDSFARDVVLLSTDRFGPGELLQELNPLDSATTAAVTIALVVGLYIARRLLDRWQERTGGLFPALLAALVEAGGLFVVLLSAFRLVEGARLWLGERRVAQWWQASLDWATGWLHFDLPDLVLRVWVFLSGTIWELHKPQGGMGVEVPHQLAVAESQHGVGGVLHWRDGYFDCSLRGVISGQREIDDQRHRGVARWNTVAPAEFPESHRFGNSGES
jgi:hypothetical protein